MLHMIFSQCSLQRPSLLRMNTMISSTEGSRGYCWSARDNKSSCSRQTIVHARQWCHHISTFRTRSTQSRRCCSNNIRLFGSAAELFFFLFVLMQIGRDGSQSKSPNLSFKWRSTSLLVVSWLFGTLTVKANVFFVHRYWFIQLFLSKCFYSAVLLFLSELTRHYSEVLCTLTLSCRDTNKAKNTV